MSSLKTPNPPTAQETAERDKLKRAAQKIQTDPDLRMWRDEYLSGMQNRMAEEVVEAVILAKNFDEMVNAKALALARAKIGDMQAAMITMGQQQ